MRVERRFAIHRVDERYDAVEPIAHHQIGVGHDRVQDRRWIGEAGRLQHDPLERLDPAVVEALQQVFERVHQIAADRAAHAARTHQHHVAVDLLDEKMVEADLAEFIDEDERIGERRRGEQSIEQRGLAGAEEAGDDGQRNGRRRRPRRATRRRSWSNRSFRRNSRRSRRDFPLAEGAHVR